MNARERGAKGLLLVSGPRSPNAGELVEMSFDSAVAWIGHRRGGDSRRGCGEAHRASRGEVARGRAKSARYREPPRDRVRHPRGRSRSERPARKRDGHGGKRRGLFSGGGWLDAPNHSSRRALRSPRSRKRWELSRGERRKGSDSSRRRRQRFRGRRRARHRREAEEPREKDPLRVRVLVGGGARPPRLIGVRASRRDSSRRACRVSQLRHGGPDARQQAGAAGGGNELRVASPHRRGERRGRIRRSGQRRPLSTDGRHELQPGRSAEPQFLHRESF